MKLEGKPLSFRVHRDLIIKHSKPFLDHKKGIPEWLKNSNTSYHRFEDRGEDFSGRPIILNFSKNSVTCLDFGGADGEVFKDKGLNYGDPEAYKQGQEDSGKYEGGHGNGGKYYGLAQFEHCDIMMYYKYKFSKFIIHNKEDREVIINEEMDPEDAFDRLDITDWKYWEQNEELYRKVRYGEYGFFVWKGKKPKDVRKITDRRKFMHLISQIISNRQAYNTIRERRVIVLREGKLFYNELQLPDIDIDPKFKEGYKRELPDKLGDYEFNKKSKSILQVDVSSKPLTSDTQDLNILMISSGNQILASYNIPSLTGNKGIAKSLIAKIDCPELVEYGCVDNDRSFLLDNEIGNEFKRWCQLSLIEIIGEIEEIEKKETDKEDFKKIGNFLQKVMDVVSDILEEEDLVKITQSPDKTKPIKKIEVPGDEPGGFGRKDKKVNKKGGGERRGKPEDKEVNVEEKRSKNKLTIKLSNIEDDPLNPGNTFDLTERHNILVQRTGDVPYGIWWLNTQKKYVNKLKEINARTTPFYLFIIKEVVFSQRSRKNFLTEYYDPDRVETLNFDLIDTIFNKATERIDIDLSIGDGNMSEEFRSLIAKMDNFTIRDISEKLDIPVTHVHQLIASNKEFVDNQFILEKEGNKNLFVRKL